MHKYANLVELEKCCQTHIFLQNFVLIQPRTSPLKICKNANFAARQIGCKDLRPGDARLLKDPGEVPRPSLKGSRYRKCIFRKCIFRKCIFRKFCKFLAGSFSAVSKRNFARKYAFDSIFQALQDLHPFAPLQSQNFRKKSV